MQKPHVLIVDDDKKIRALLKQYLKNNNFLVSDAENAVQAKEIMQDFSFDILILDVMMPGQNGFEFAAEIRQDSQIPIIMLTAMAETENKITGLETGVDDYLAKPFDPKELLLRINSVLRRAMLEKQQNEVISLGKCRYNLKYDELLLDNQSIPLTSSEKQLLRLLIKNQGQIMTREDIAAQLDLMDNPRTVDVQITRIRKKIEEDTRNPMIIQTVRGKGYMLIS